MKKVLVWDWPVRVMHWLMAILFSGLIITGNIDADVMDWHFYMGYGLSAVIVARVLYGVVGSRFARFTQFIYHPIDTFKYLKTLLTGRGKHYLGHNPVGGLMVIALLIAMTIQWLTGLFNSDEVFWFGPFYNWGSDYIWEMSASLHRQLPDVLLILIALHILAVLYHEVRFKERLIGSMIHGKKPIQNSAEHQQEEGEARTPRVGVIISLLLSLAWLAWLWSIPF